MFFWDLILIREHNDKINERKSCVEVSDVRQKSLKETWQMRLTKALGTQMMKDCNGIKEGEAGTKASEDVAEEGH